MTMENDGKIVQDTKMDDDEEANDDEIIMEAEEVVETPENVEELVELAAKRRDDGDDLKERLKNKLDEAKRKKYVEEEKRRLDEAYEEVVRKNDAKEKKKNEAKKGNGHDGGLGATKKAKEVASGATASRRGARTTTQMKAVGRRSSR